MTSHILTFVSWLFSICFKGLLLICGLISTIGHAAAELVPAVRLTQWTPGTRVGVPGGIDQYLPGGANERTNVIDVTKAPYSADNTGKSDASIPIQKAIDAARAQQVVYLPAGTYRLDKTLNLEHHKDNITIRGAGVGSTIIRPKGGAGFVTFGSSDGWSWPVPPPVVADGVSRDSTSLTFEDTSHFAVGALLLLGFQNQTDDTAIKNGSVPVVSVSGYDSENNTPVRRQVTRIAKKGPTTLTISPGIYHTPVSGLSAKAWVAQLQIERVGIEDLAVDVTSSTVPFPINLQHAYACWVKNVKVSRVANYGMAISDSLQCEIRHCEVRERKTKGANGAALLVNTVSGSLFEDNILYDVFPCIEVNHGSCGNVFAYNLCENPPVSGEILFAIDTNHGPHNSLNLYEGNVAPNIISDGYFGGESELTAFRNWLHGSCFDSSEVTYAHTFKRFTRTASMVGNILGKAGVARGGLTFGQPNIGNGTSKGTAQPTLGDFWQDWRATGTLIARRGETTGTFTFGTGRVFAGQLVTMRWGGTNFRQINAGSVTGNSVTFTGGAGTVLPPKGTQLALFMGPAGYQEADLDVQATTIDKGNYSYGPRGATGSMSKLGGDALPASLFRGSKPLYFGKLAWPPFDPTSPNEASYDDIPAGYRWLHSGEDPPRMAGDRASRIERAR